MATLVLRQVKGSPVTDPEMDSNFSNLNRDSFLSVRNSTPWVANTSFAKGEILNVLDRFYLVTTGGTTGATTPTHTSGGLANGTTVLQATAVVSYTAKDVLEKVKYLGGTGSGLDTDLVRGLAPSSALPSTTDKSSIVSRNSTGDSVFNNIVAAGISANTIQVTLATAGSINLTGNLTLNGAAGSSGQVLVSGGAGQIPSWVTINPNPTLTEDNTNTTKYVVFADGVGVQGLKIDSVTTAFTYNPSTNTLNTIAAGNPKYGANTFTDHQTVPVETYSSSWSGNLTVPTKADIYTKIQSLNKPGEVCYFARSTTPDGFLKANGAAVSIAVYTELANAIYCGDSLNASALFGYKCTDPANASTTRSTSGAYIVLPDLRGEFPRGWDDARGVDTGRAFGTAQGDAIRNIVGSLTQGGQIVLQTASGAFYVSANSSGFFDSGGGSGPGVFTFDASRVVPTAAENRPRNIALLACIRY